ncbi:MAG: DUF4129 domain-containing protein [Acidimicrobiia bacterium]|nr:DUF4129 domain-containing protein [Acidimicrobiia bacterium]
MTELSRTARWMVLPGAILLLALVGLALAAEPEPERPNGASQSPTSEIEQRSLDDQSGTGDSDNDSVRSPSVTVSSDRGEVEIRFDPDGVARASVEGDATEFDLVPGTESGVRLDENGRLQPVPPGRIGPDDVGFTPSSEGVDVHAAGNPIVELRPDGVSGGVSATEYADGPDGDDGQGRGAGTTLTPGNGVVELSDGTTISPVEEPGGSLIATPAGPMPWRWIFTTIAALAVISATVGYLLHRNYQEADLQVQATPTTARVDENFEQFLARLAADGDPKRAIRLGFHAVEQGLGGLPVRNGNETPFEWHRRVSDTIPTVEEPLGHICDLFAKARFAPGDATVDDRDRMIWAIQALLTGVHTPTPSDGLVIAP